MNFIEYTSLALKNNKMLFLYNFLIIFLTNLAILMVLLTSEINSIQVELDIMNINSLEHYHKYFQNIVYKDKVFYMVNKKSVSILKDYIPNVIIGTKTIKFLTHNEIFILSEYRDRGVIISIQDFLYPIYHNIYIVIPLFFIVNIIILIFTLYKKNKIIYRTLNSRDNKMYTKSLVTLAENLHHELNTPLAVLSNKVNKIKKCTVLDCNHDMDFELINDSIKQISEVLRRMRSYKHIAKSNSHSLYSIMETACNALLVTNSNKFEYEISKELKEYKANGQYIPNSDLIGIITNMVKNSLEANATKIKFTFGKKNGVCTFYIGDNGNGIPENIKPNIYKKDFSSKTKNRGNGLYISSVLLDDAGGDIKLIDSSEKGTIFEINCPVKKITLTLDDLKF